MTRHRNNDHPQPALRRHPRSKPSRKRSRSRQVVAWIGGLAGIAVAAFITTFSTTLGNNIVAFFSRPGIPVGLPVRIDLVNVTNSEGDSYVFPRAFVLTQRQLASLNSPHPFTPGYERWFLSRGAIDTAPIDIQLVVAGNRAHAVRIVDIRPVVTCKAAPHGTLFLSPPAGSQGSTQLYLDLGQPQPALSYRQGTRIVDYFTHYTVSLAYGEQFTFQIIATTPVMHYCQFSLDVIVLDNGRTVMERVGNHGKPFQVTASYRSSRYSVLYIGGVDSITPGGKWSRADPATYRDR
jgi:hypothetical protein